MLVQTNVMRPPPPCKIPSSTRPEAIIFRTVPDSKTPVAAKRKSLTRTSSSSSLHCQWSVTRRLLAAIASAPDQRIELKALKAKLGVAHQPVYDSVNVLKALGVTFVPRRSFVSLSETFVAVLEDGAKQKPPSLFEMNALHRLRQSDLNGMCTARSRVSGIGLIAHAVISAFLEGGAMSCSRLSLRTGFALQRVSVVLSVLSAIKLVVRANKGVYELVPDWTPAVIVNIINEELAGVPIEVKRQPCKMEAACTSGTDLKPYRTCPQMESMMGRFPISSALAREFSAAAGPPRGPAEAAAPLRPGGAAAPLQSAVAGHPAPPPPSPPAAAAGSPLPRGGSTGLPAPLQHSAGGDLPADRMVEDDDSAGPLDTPMCYDMAEWPLHPDEDSQGSSDSLSLSSSAVDLHDPAPSFGPTSSAPTFGSALFGPLSPAAACAPTPACLGQFQGTGYARLGRIVDDL